MRPPSHLPLLSVPATERSLVAIRVLVHSNALLVAWPVAVMLGNGCSSPSSSAVRRRRGRPSGSGGGAGGGGGRHGYWHPFSLQKQEQKRQHDRNLAVPPLTEFDRAYFRAYSHVGVHEEMIKVFPFSLSPSYRISCWLWFGSFIVLSCIRDRMMFSPRKLKTPDFFYSVPFISLYIRSGSSITYSLNFLSKSKLTSIFFPLKFYYDIELVFFFKSSMLTAEGERFPLALTV